VSPSRRRVRASGVDCGTEEDCTTPIMPQQETGSRSLKKYAGRRAAEAGRRLVANREAAMLG